MMARITISITLSVTYVVFKGISLFYTLILIITGIMGSSLGIFLVNKVDAKSLQKFIGILILALGIMVLTK